MSRCYRIMTKGGQPPITYIPKRERLQLLRERDRDMRAWLAQQLRVEERTLDSWWNSVARRPCTTGEILDILRIVCGIRLDSLKEFLGAHSRGHALKIIYSKSSPPIDRLVDGFADSLEQAMADGDIDPETKLPVLSPYLTKAQAVHFMELVQDEAVKNPLDRKSDQKDYNFALQVKLGAERVGGHLLSARGYEHFKSIMHRHTMTSEQLKNYKPQFTPEQRMEQTNHRRSVATSMRHRRDGHRFKQSPQPGTGRSRFGD